MEQVDVIIVGAGLSGIGAACHLTERCPAKTFVILEGRESMGGTWDLFRYPGIRSDSDMFTLGYRFRPWREAKAIADGGAILNYIHDTAREYDVDGSIRYRHKVRHASWSSEKARWTVRVETADGETELECKFLYLCTGYYVYEAGYTPEWPGFDDYRGTLVHPQHWPEQLDYSGKKIVVIGSGATAVTLVPALADRAAHVTMLQRSPTYIVAQPSEDRIASLARRALPDKAAYAVGRWKNILRQKVFYDLAKKKPEWMKRLINKGLRNELGEYNQRDFTPTYNPWQQRLCLVPDGDLFKSLKAGTSSILTDEIERFDEEGVVLKSGKRLDADIIVTATGLQLKIMSGLDLEVDGQPVDLSKTIAYKGMMYSDVPNLAQAFGYTNASWTLKCDLTSEYVCRLLNTMDRKGYVQCTARRTDPTVREEPVLDFTSTYVQRVIHTLPKQGSKRPWRLYQDYFKDLMTMRYGPLEDGVMEFRKTK
ncbi:MAG TPA: NAD(P)/FAD-dependent oxidoreductase [Pyrinomonadaceae bacterium]|jgi:cation diffusion facilitator CzcD-associated flavoprotein CzcO|nr:NAD(P)/FAD-dependent oxidoreductase [Pyrinomonadaceae bacterium]